MKKMKYDIWDRYAMWCLRRSEKVGFLIALLLPTSTWFCVKRYIERNCVIYIRGEPYHGKM